MSTAPAPDRNPSLDGVRGVAILLVLWFHAHYPAPIPTRFDTLVYASSAYGWAGVDLFFVLSGFLITRILIASCESPRYYSAFYARRVLRIFPLYYAALLLWHVLGPIVAHRTAAEIAQYHREEPWLWAYLANVRQALNPGATALDTTHFWSLSVEEQFYLVWPLVVRRAPPRHLGAVCVVGFAMVVLTRAGLRLGGVNVAAIYTLLPTRADGLLVGAALAVWMRGSYDPARWRVRAWGVALASGVALAIGIVASTLHGGFGEAREFGAFMQYAGYSLFAVLFGALLVVALLAPAEARLSRALQSPVLQLFGRYSYGVYVIHYLLRGPLNDLWAPLVRRTGGTALGSLVLLAYPIAMVGITLVLSMASWRWFEAPLLRYKDRFPY